MIRIKFLLRSPKKKGMTAIYATLCYRNKRIIVFPGKSIHTSKWVNKKNINEPKDIPENDELKEDLANEKKLYKKVYEDMQRIFKSIVPPEQLKDAIYAAKNKSEPIIEEVKPVLITTFFQTLIDDSKSGIRKTKDDLLLDPNSIKPYVSALNHFIEFQKKQKRKYYLTDMSQKLVKDFTDYLNGKLAINASAKYLTVFKLIITYATEKKLLDINQVSNIKVNVKKEKSDSIYLTEQEIKDMMAIKEFSTPVYEIVRDLFVIGCNTGLRFSDYSILRFANIKDGFIEIDPAKTKNKIRTNTKVIIPLHPMVKQILLKYPDGFPKCPPNQVFNRYLKEIGKMVPTLDKEFEKKMTRSHKVEKTIYAKYSALCTHTARRSFCTNMYLKGVPVITIMAISGHKTQENFMKYIKADNQKHAEILRKKFDEDENAETCAA